MQLKHVIVGLPGRVGESGVRQVAGQGGNGEFADGCGKRLPQFLQAVRIFRQPPLRYIGVELDPGAAVPDDFGSKPPESLRADGVEAKPENGGDAGTAPELGRCGGAFGFVAGKLCRECRKRPVACADRQFRFRRPAALPEIEGALRRRHRQTGLQNEQQQDKFHDDGPSSFGG